MLHQGGAAAAGADIDQQGQKLAAQLRPGMSVIVRVDTRSKPMD